VQKLGLVGLGRNNLLLDIEKISNEKVFLIGVVTGGLSPEVVEEHLDELELLTETAGAETVGRFTQRVNRISPKYFIGKGKAEQIVNQAKMLDVNLIVFDDELSPTQVRNFMRLAESIKVIDRTALILDIFTQHARTREAKTQVELARLEYMLPRLTRMWTHLERQMGGIGTRAGAGETQIEIDRRLVRDRISKLQKEMKGIEKERETQSRRREQKFRISLVGYTNAGKSTLLNVLTGADVYIKDQLFATLDTTVRSLVLDRKHKVLISDSVGFIRKLPHSLVASFKSTLKEAVDSDLLLLVVDASSRLLDEQLETVKEVLTSIGTRGKETVVVANKIDLLTSSELRGLKDRFPHAIFISAQNHLRLDALLERMKKSVESSYQTAEVTFSASLGKEIASVYERVEVLEQDYQSDEVHLKIRGNSSVIEQIVAQSEDGEA